MSHSISQVSESTYVISAFKAKSLLVATTDVSALITFCAEMFIPFQAVYVVSVSVSTVSQVVQLYIFNT